MYSFRRILLVGLTDLYGLVGMNLIYYCFGYLRMLMCLTLSLLVDYWFVCWFVSLFTLFLGFDCCVGWVFCLGRFLVVGN